MSEIQDIKEKKCQTPIMENDRNNKLPDLVNKQKISEKAQ